MMYLHGDVFVQYKNIFCKKTKIEIVPQFDLFINVLAMPCVTIQGDLLLLDWCYTQWEKNMQCYAVCCTVFTTPYIHNSVEFHLFHT